MEIQKMEIQKYKWYKASELNPEQTLLTRDRNGIEGWFIVVESNGDMYCANRWKEGERWYWDTDNEYADRRIEKEGISHWMLVEPPQE